MPILRTIIESDQASKTLEALRRKYDRFEDWWINGWSWRLTRDPFKGSISIPDTSPQVYILKSSPNHAEYGFPFTLTFLYIVRENEIVIEDILFAEIHLPQS